MPLTLTPGQKLERFLAELALGWDVVASTQNQTFNAIAISYMDVLVTPPRRADALRATLPVHLRHAPIMSESRDLLQGVPGLAACGNCSSAARSMKSRVCEKQRVGKFARFELSVRTNLGGEVDLVLHGKNSYPARLTDSALDTIRSLEATVQDFEDWAARLDTDITDAQKRAEELEGKVGAPFEREARYQELSRRQDEIEEQLDLTKNQAPSQADSASQDVAETTTERQSATSVRSHRDLRVGGQGIRPA